MAVHRAAILWLLCFTVIPLALYIAAVVTPEWVSYTLLPGSQLRAEDDDEPEYVKRSAPVLGPTVVLRYNWTGALTYGLWEYYLDPDFHNSTPPASHHISDCYQSPTGSGHHRVCPTLILVRSFVVTSPILTVLFSLSLIRMFYFRHWAMLSSPVDALVFSFIPPLVASIGWIVFHVVVAKDLTRAAEFLPLYLDPSFSWELKEVVGFSQLLFILAWAFQFTAVFLFAGVHCFLNRPRQNQELAPLFTA
eukprot:m.235908 g.235908  ORF g.235908 m.235908 type:complete len:249 (+) comp20328_c0_seq1:13-759(+)